MSKIRDMLEILFESTPSNTKETIIECISKYGIIAGLNTDMRVAQFLAQVREEVGSEFEVKRENLNYKSEALPKIFGKRFTEAQAKQYGRGVNSANQEAIANLAYGNRLGNGAPDSDGDGDMDKYDDGWKYRGAGCLQITGKSNFAEVQKRCVRIVGKEMDPDTLEGFIVFGMAYWLWKDCYIAADTGNPDNVTAIINKHTHSYDARRMYYNKIKHLVG